MKILLLFLLFQADSHEEWVRHLSSESIVVRSDAEDALVKAGKKHGKVFSDTLPSSSFLTWACPE